MNIDGTYTYTNIGTKASSYTLAKTDDYNGDGITDILWRKGSSNYLWYMHADGTHTYKKISGKSSGYLVADGISTSPSAEDTTPPVITLNGDARIILNINDPFRDEGASAYDDMDGIVEVTTSGTVDVNTVGIYTLTYSAIDTAGNSADEVVRTVVVKEATPALSNATIDEYLTTINNARAQARNCGVYGDFPAVLPVTWSDKLYKAAYEHSQDMTSANYFSHDGSGLSSDWTGFPLYKQSNMAERIENYNYTWYRLSENITAGTDRDTAQKAIDSWLLSDGHCKNIMDGEMTEVGMALSSDNSTQYTHYWTQNFGTAYAEN